MVNQVTHGESKTPMYVDDLRGMAAQNRNWPMTSQLLEKSVYSCWGTGGTVPDHQYEVFKLVNPQVRLID